MLKPFLTIDTPKKKKKDRWSNNLPFFLFSSKWNEMPMKWARLTALEGEVICSIYSTVHKSGSSTELFLVSSIWLFLLQHSIFQVLKRVKALVPFPLTCSPQSPLLRRTTTRTETWNCFCQWRFSLQFRIRIFLPQIIRLLISCTDSRLKIVVQSVKGSLTVTLYTKSIFSWDYKGPTEEKPSHKKWFCMQKISVQNTEIKPKGNKNQTNATLVFLLTVKLFFFCI